MKRSFVAWFGSGLAGLFCTAAVSAAEPQPVLDFDFSKAANGIVKDGASSGLSLTLGPDAAVKDGALVLNPSEKSFAAADEAAFRKWAKNLRKNEIAACFWIRFDKGVFASAKNSDSASLGLFDCFLDQDGRIAVKVFTEKTSLLKPVVLTGKFKAEYGKWYHVEFSFSMNERRTKLYIDGKFQMENDKLILPTPAVGMLKLGNGFRGAVRDLKFYDAALESEELAISDASAADYDALKASADAIAAKSVNGYLGAWARDLSKQASALKANAGKTTIAAYKRLARSIGNAQTMADGISGDAAKTTVSNSIVTTYVTPATTQALYLPYSIPENGSLSNKIEIIMAQNEYESASVIVFPFAPIKNFTLSMGDLRNGNNVLKGSDTDIKLVKRWYRAGGAWMAYHVDLYMRVLTPDMLLNDDKLVKVDEFRRTNQVLMHYPGGDQYQEVSDFKYDRVWVRDHIEQFLYDAPTLQPVEFKEAGRNQQYLVRFHAPKGTAPGFYEGKLNLIADGRNAGSIDVTIRVLPFALSEPKTYCDLNKTYLSHVNSWDGRPAPLKNACEYNLYHLSRVASTPENILECKKQNYPLDIVFTSISGLRMPEFGAAPDKMTPELKARMEKIAIAPALRYQKMFEKYSGLKDYKLYIVWTSESSWYGAIASGPDQMSTLLHANTHVKLFSHGMSFDLEAYSPGIYDMDSSSCIEKRYAEVWHSIGGRTINYAFPFPGPENPGLMRRAMGLELYKANHYDGHMMHGYLEGQLNEFTKYPGGDGDYRTFCLAYTCKDSQINRLSIVGYREGFDDVRYATLLKQQAADAIRNSKDELVIKEAKRQLLWLELVDGDKMDMDDFRANVQYRILTLAELIKAREGKVK